MIDVLITYIFYSEIIHNKGERDGSPFVSPKAGSVDALIISVWGKSFPKEFVC